MVSLPWGYHCRKQAPCFTTVLFSVFLVLIQVDFDVMYLRVQIIESFEGTWHEHYRKIIPEVIQAYAYQLLLGGLLRTSKGMSPPSHNEVCYASVISLFDFKQIWHANPSLRVAAFLKNSYSITCQLIMEPSGRFAYHVMPASSSDYTKSYHDSASRTADGPN